MIRGQATRLADTTSGFTVYHAVDSDLRRAQRHLKLLGEKIESGGAEADILEIRWAVERKCVYWAAVDIVAVKLAIRERADEVLAALLAARDLEGSIEDRRRKSI